jgi:hypothetical protein
MDIPINKLVYSKDGEYHYCDKLIADYWPNHLSHGKDHNITMQGCTFNGATGDVVRIVSPAEFKASRDGVEEVPQYIRQAMIDAGIKLNDGDRVSIDSCGRCFDAQEMLSDLRSIEPAKTNGGDLKIYDLELFQAIIGLESTNEMALDEIEAHNKIDQEYEQNKAKKQKISQVLRHIKGLKTALNALK